MERESGSSGERVHRDEVVRSSMQLLHHDDLLVYRADGGIDQMHFIATGEVRVQTWQVGGETMSFEREVHEPILDKSYSTLDSYIESMQRLAEDDGDILYYPPERREEPICHPELAAAIISAITEQHEQYGDVPHYIECPVEDCEGGEVNGPCLCTLVTGSSYTSLDGSLVSADRTDEADPDCSTCGGTGKRMRHCYLCKTAGRIRLDPTLFLMNKETSQSTEFRLDASEILNDERVKFEVTDSPRLKHRASDKEPRYYMYIDMSELVFDKAREIGIDVDGDNYTTYWGDGALETYATTFGHLIRPIAAYIKDEEHFADHDEFIAAAINEIQERLRLAIRTDTWGVDPNDAAPEDMRAEAHRFLLDMREDMTIDAAGMLLENKPHASELLDDIMVILDGYDLRLGLAYTGIATGESGPALYITDIHGNLLYEMAYGYDPVIVLRNAHNAIQEADRDGTLEKLATNG